MPGGKTGGRDQLSAADAREMLRRRLAEWTACTSAEGGDVQAGISGAEGTFLCGGRRQAAVRIIGIACRMQRLVAARIACSYALGIGALSANEDERRRLRHDVRRDKRGVKEHAQQRGRGRGNATMPMQSPQAHD